MIVSPKRVSFQGELGANSHIASKDVFPDAEVVPCATFEDALGAVQSGDADLGMIPIENSIAGRVGDIHHFLPIAGLHIIGEYFMPIRFQLMALPGASLATIKVAKSHVVALGQCRKIIRKLGLKAEVVGDTAGAARMVSQSDDLTAAAIAPRLAAEVYGLNILAEDIEDEAHNTTRFIILSRQMLWASPKEDCVTSFVFEVRNMPAALYKAMGGFATNGINMTKLESYMVGGHFVATQFYAEVDGHPEQPGLKRALEELRYFSKDVKVLGVYPAHDFRREAMSGE